jgi:hypothetical protein
MQSSDVKKIVIDLVVSVGKITLCGIIKIGKAVMIVAGMLLDMSLYP